MLRKRCRCQIYSVGHERLELGSEMSNSTAPMSNKIEVICIVRISNEPGSIGLGFLTRSTFKNFISNVKVRLFGPRKQNEQILGKIARI